MQEVLISLHIHFGAVIQTLVRLSVWQTVCLAERGWHISLVPRPLPDFILQLWRKITLSAVSRINWEWHGNEARLAWEWGWVGMGMRLTAWCKQWQHVAIIMKPSPHYVLTESTISSRDVILIPGLLPIFLHSCEIKSGCGLGTRLPQKRLEEREIFKTHLQNLVWPEAIISHNFQPLHTHFIEAIKTSPSLHSVNTLSLLSTCFSQKSEF